MILRGINCAGGRAGALRAGARLPRHFASSPQVRLLSAGGLQRAGPLAARVGLFNAPGNSRNFWWSSKGSSQEPAALNEIDSAPVEQNDVEPVTPVEEPPVETATTVESTNALDSTPIADATSVVVDDSSHAAVEPLANSLTDTIAQITPLQYGDFAAMGLGGWSPIGLSQSLYEIIQISTGMPWFWTIVTGTVIGRLILFPFALKALRNAARMAPHQGEFEKLRVEIDKAARTRDQGSMQRALLKQQALYQKIGVSVGGMLVPPLAQVPITLGMFFGVKRICDLPVPQLKDGGIGFWTDLAVPDPTYILPIAATAGMNWVLMAGMRDMSPTPHMPHIINFFRGLTLFGLVFMTKFSAGVMIYLLTGIVCMGIQSMALRIPAVRTLLGLPLRAASAGTKSVSMMDSIRYAKKQWEQKKAEALEKARADRRLRR